MKIACVLMQRNEAMCLDPWLRYHGHLFGYENLFVIDYGSDEPFVLGALDEFASYGGHVSRLPATADYRRKGEFVSQKMREIEAGYDFVLPLDCDEFVAMREPDKRPTCSKQRLADYFSSLPPAMTAFAVSENFLNMLGHPKLFFALPYQKIFFRGGYCRKVDHGSHEMVESPAPTGNTCFAYVHFHHKSFQRYRRAVEEKLRPFVDIDDAEALARFRGSGWHLVIHLQKTEQEYYAIMKPDSRCIEFPGLYETFLDLGLDPSFCER